MLTARIRQSRAVERVRPCLVLGGEHDLHGSGVVGLGGMDEVDGSTAGAGHERSLSDFRKAGKVYCRSDA
jgi:hypothetical protein